MSIPRHFPAVLIPSRGGGYVARCPLIEGCITQGETREEALDNLKDAIELCLRDPQVRADLERLEDVEVRLAV